jgi:hypothetical protein
VQLNQNRGPGLTEIGFFASDSEGDPHQKLSSFQWQSDSLCLHSFPVLPLSFFLKAQFSHLLTVYLLSVTKYRVKPVSNLYHFLRGRHLRRGDSRVYAFFKSPSSGHSLKVLDFIPPSSSDNLATIYVGINKEDIQCRSYKYNEYVE